MNSVATQPLDIMVVGAGAAGLFASLWAARTRPNLRIVAVDGAKKLGAKILVSGGGRCNVTHDVVDESAYAGSSRHAIRKVLQQFNVEDTITFFEEQGLALKREVTGKLFPVTDDAHSVLNALLTANQQAGVRIWDSCRIESISVQDGETGFTVAGGWGSAHAQRIILATGGQSLPKSGSDGGGYQLARSLGHTLTPHILPALVPLTLPKAHPLLSLSGLTVPATLSLFQANGKLLISFTDSTLCTHFGLSGPCVLDFSRHYLIERREHPTSYAAINWLPAYTAEQLEAELLDSRYRAWSLLRLLSNRLPERLTRVLGQLAHVEASAAVGTFTREQRKAVVQTVTQLVLPFTGDRGFNYAEVTAGGVPLAELKLESMESRRCAGLHLCGEICDVDGRIGGYNFQWAWASGYVAGRAAALACDKA